MNMRLLCEVMVLAKVALVDVKKGSLCKRDEDRTNHRDCMKRSHPASARATCAYAVVELLHRKILQKVVDVRNDRLSRALVVFANVGNIDSSRLRNVFEGRAHPSVMMRSPSRTSASVRSCGVQPETSSPSAVRPVRMYAGISGSGFVPRVIARCGSPFSFARRLKWAAAITLFAEPCSQTKTMVFGGSPLCSWPTARRADRTRTAASGHAIFI